MVQPSSLRRRVVVTGMGVVSPIGVGREAFWQSLLEGRSGIAPFQQLPDRGLPIHIAGEVRDFEPRLVPQRKSLKVMCREIQLGVAAANLALQDSALDSSKVNPDRFGVDYGANLMLTLPDELASPVLACLDEAKRFHFERWGETGMRQMFPLWLLKYLPNMPACHIGIAFDARGPNNTITLGEASANLAIAEAYRIIARGAADVMFGGATGTRVHPLVTVQTVLLEELSHRNGSPAAACRPFDAQRDGMVVGEGAAAFILEELDHARARGATIYGEVIGAGSSCSAQKDGTACIRRALGIAMRSALRDGGVAPEQLGHLNAHGLSTRKDDVEEARAILDVFGDRGRSLPVLAAKSYFGNLGAGTGAVELAASLLAIHHQHLPATLNYEHPDPECPLNVVARGGSSPGQTFLKTSFTRMGQASCLLVKQFAD